ncbi:LytR/AlgR family response regulator transcription factor [Mucilaginibacter angelicae]|uniref:LytR/AlgR family response regulator transcription factor n=1 Tax=Mucilaginibacter angelicae TaxID=869718 RepID=A0ABV6L579_9SPHI
MITNIYIIDDEAHAIKVIASHIRKTPGLALAGSSTDPLLALDEISRQRPDITFLDIDMPEISGITMAQLLNGLTTVVFSTSFRNYGPEAFQSGVADYLLKPVGYDLFLRCVQKIKNNLPAAPASTDISPNSFFVKGQARGKYHRISPAQVILIESEQHHCRITLPGEKITVPYSISTIMEKLPAPIFQRVHRAFIINIEKIRFIDTGAIHMENNETVPIGRNYRESFLQKINGS